MRIWSCDSILTRQSRAELLDVLLSHTLELNKVFKFVTKNKNTDLLPLEVLLHLVLLAGQHGLVVLHGRPPVVLLAAQLGVNLGLDS